MKAYTSYVGKPTDGCSHESLWRKSYELGALRCLKHYSSLVNSLEIHRADINGILPIQYAMLWGRPFVDCARRYGASITVTLHINKLCFIICCQSSVDFMSKPLDILAVGGLMDV